MKMLYRYATLSAILLILTQCSKEEDRNPDEANEISDVSDARSNEDQKADSQAATEAELSVVAEARQETRDEMMARIEAEAERVAAERKKKEKASRQLTASKARSLLVGKKLPNFVTKGERAFENVTVTEADALELTIMHASGAAKIPYPDLPEDLQKRVRYYKEDYAEALAARDEPAIASAQATTAPVSAAENASANVQRAVEVNGAPSTSAFDGEPSEMPDYNVELTKAQGEQRRIILELSQAKLQIRQMYSQYIRGVQSQKDRKLVEQMAAQLRKLQLDEAHWKAEVDAMRAATLIGPHQYERLKPIWESFRKALHEAGAAKAEELTAAENIGWLEALESSARIKSSAHQAAVKRAEAALRTAERVRAQKDTEARLRRHAFDKTYAAQ